MRSNIIRDGARAAGGGRLGAALACLSARLSARLLACLSACLLACLLLWPRAAEAQSQAGLRDPDQAYAALSECLRGARGSAAGRACLDRAVDPCLQAPGNHTTVGMASCVAAEASGWDRLLNEAYAGARKALDGPGRKALLDAQRKWLAFRDAGCAVWREVYRGGSLAQLSELECMRVQTARRTLDLRAIVESGAR